MATATRRHAIVNPARRNRPKARRRNKPRRHMSAKQIKFFGTSAQRAALKRKRKGSSAKSHRRRNVARANPKPRKRAVAKRTHRVHHRKRTAKRSNPGEILSLTLGNPAKRRKKVAAKHHRKRKMNARRSHARRNPAKRRNVRHHSIRHRRRNPGVGGMIDLFVDGALVIGGLVGSRLLTQMVMGTNNTGPWGYAGNAIATAALATAAHMATKKPRFVNDLIVGGAAGIVARILQDYTPIGQYLTQAGVGDYAGGGAHGVGLYLPSNAVWPQRYVDAANSALVQIPTPGWAPTIAAPAAGSGAGTGMSGLYDGGSGGGLYS